MPQLGQKEQLKGLDRRVIAVEQILPTLATKQDLESAIAPLATKAELAAAIAPLATKAELAAAIAPLATRAELAAAIAPLATKAELAQESIETRRHFDIVAESLRSDIKLVIELLGGKQERTDAAIEGLRRSDSALDRRVTRLEAARLKRR